VFVSTGSVLLLYQWARLAVGPRPAVVAAALMALEPHTAFFTTTLLTETLFVFVFLASMLLLMQGISRKSLGRFVASGVLLGAATLVRPICQFFPVVAAGIVLFHRRLRWSFRLKAVALVVAFFMLTIAPWLARNQIVYGHASLSCMKGANLLLWGATSTVVARTGRPVDEVREEFREMARERGAREDGNPFENSRIYQEIAMEQIRADFGGYVARHWKGIEGMFLYVGTKTVCDYLGLPSHELPFYLFAAPSRREMLRAFLEVRAPHEIAIAAVLGLYGPIMYLSAAGAVIVLFRRRKFAPVLVAAAVIAYFCLMIGTNPHPRYKLPLVPFYVTLSGLGLLELWRLATRRWRSRRLPGAAG
jgi:4-amino-4-deoxy-L-arabinose transferase-like glycosyltransferase